MRDVTVPEKDLAGAKRAIVGRFALGSRARTRSSRNYIDRYFYKLPADYWDTYAAKIEAVTPGTCNGWRRLTGRRIDCKSSPSGISRGRARAEEARYGSGLRRGRQTD